MTLDEWRALRRQARVTNRDEEPDVLAPPEAFSDRRADQTLRDEYLLAGGRTSIAIFSAMWRMPLMITWRFVDRYLRRRQRRRADPYR